jgi:hypothetical protein
VYVVLAFVFLYSHFSSLTWWNFNDDGDTISTSVFSLSPPVLLLYSYFLVNLTTVFFFAVLSLLVQVIQCVLK